MSNAEMSFLISILCWKWLVAIVDMICVSVGQNTHSILLKEDCCSLHLSEPNNTDVSEEESLFRTLLMSETIVLQGLNMTE